MDVRRPAIAAPRFLMYAGAVLSVLLMSGQHTARAGIIDDLKARQAQVRTITARFTQEKHSRLLSKPIRSSGTFMYRQPDRIRWEYTGGINMLVLYTGKELWIYYPELREAEQIRGMPQYTSLMHFDIGRMSRDYEITVSREMEVTRLVFEPKRKGPVGLIEMEFSEGASFPRGLRLTDSHGEITHLIFKEIVLNGEIGDGLFNFVPDSTVRVRERTVP